MSSTELLLSQAHQLANHVKPTYRGEDHRRIGRRSRFMSWLLSARAVLAGGRSRRAVGVSATLHTQTTLRIAMRQSR